MKLRKLTSMWGEEEVALQGGAPPLDPPLSVVEVDGNLTVFRGL